MPTPVAKVVSKGFFVDCGHIRLDACKCVVYKRGQGEVLVDLGKINRNQMLDLAHALIRAEQERTGETPEDQALKQTGDD